MREATLQEQIEAVRQACERLATIEANGYQSLVIWQQGQAEKELAAMRAVLTTLETSQWRPIEEAPKDGTDLLTWVNSEGALDGCVVAFWHTKYHKWIAGEQWCEVNPVQWLPLPAPPSDPPTP